MAENEITDDRMSEDELFNLLLELLETTTPYKHEQRIRDLLPTGMWIDKCGNAWGKILRPNGQESETLFCCHMDTVGFAPEKTDPFYHKGFIYAMSNKSSCLGGDDRCGVLCLIALMAAKVPGTYLFHVGEEKGTIGAEFASKAFKMDNFKRAIEFDRRGTTSIITVMMGSTRVCSEAFSKALASQLNGAGNGLEYKSDDTGLYTDVMEYSEDISECTNLSVGYQSEHSNNEKINADWLIRQFIPSLYDIKWEELPAERNPKGDNSTLKQNYNHHSGKWNKGNNHVVTYNPNTVVGSAANKGNSSSKKADSSAEIGADYIGNYNAEHGFGDDDDDITSIDGLTVFDEKDFFDSCNFCGERGDNIVECFFEGKFWDLCSSCKEFLQLEDSLQKRDDEKEVSEDELEIASLKKGAKSEKEESITGNNNDESTVTSNYYPIGYIDNGSPSDNDNNGGGGFMD